MFQARSFNVRTGALSEKPVYPSAHERVLRADPQAGDDLIFFDFKSGNPLIFHAGADYERNGRARHMRPHFQRQEGYGLDNPDRRKSCRQGFAKYAASAKALLVVDGLSPVFAYKARDLNFRGDEQARHCIDVGKWIALNRGQFFTQAITSANDAILAIRDLKGRYRGPDGQFKDLCFASYNGGVAPYERFFLGWHGPVAVAKSQNRLREIYNDLSSGKQCALITSEAGAKTDPNRAVGLPVLLHFVPTGTTLKAQGKDGLHGNLTSLDDRPGHVITDLHVSDELKKSGGDEALCRMVINAGERGIYVLATPVVTYDPAIAGARPINGHREWHPIRFVLNDLARQTSPVGQSSAQSSFAPSQKTAPTHPDAPPGTLWNPVPVVA